MGQKDRNGNPWNRVDIEKVPRDERVGTGFLNLIIYQIDISQLSAQNGRAKKSDFQWTYLK